MTIITIAGYGGSGKTLLGVILTTYLKEKGYQVISNVKSYKYVDIDFETGIVGLINDIKKEGKEQRKIMTKRVAFIDEIQNYLDSRESMKRKNIMLTQKIFQFRKYKIDMICTLQDYLSMDVRLRRLTQYIMLPQFDEDEHILSYVVLNGRTNEYLYEKKFFIPDNILELYDTYEDIDGDLDFSSEIANKKLKNSGFIIEK